MASQVSNHTVRTVAGRVQHALFPSRRWALVALAVEVTAVLAQLPPAAHLVVAIAAHIALAALHRRGGR